MLRRDTTKLSGISLQDVAKSLTSLGVSSAWLQISGGELRNLRVLIIAAAIGVGRIARSVVALLRDVVRSNGRALLLQRFGLSLTGNVFFLISGWLAVRGQYGSDFWSLLASGMIAMLVSGARSAWLLVTHPRPQN